jgi:hypothetical protein
MNRVGLCFWTSFLRFGEPFGVYVAKRNDLYILLFFR